MMALLNNSAFVGLTLVLLGIICYGVNAAVHDPDLGKMAQTVIVAGLGFLGGAGHSELPQTNGGAK